MPTEKIPENSEILKQGEGKKKYPIKIVCSNCKRDMGEKEGGETEGLISHSICPECARLLYPDIMDEIEKEQ